MLISGGVSAAVLLAAVLASSEALKEGECEGKLEPGGRLTFAQAIPIQKVQITPRNLNQISPARLNNEEERHNVIISVRIESVKCKRLMCFLQFVRRYI